MSRLPQMRLFVSSMGSEPQDKAMNAISAILSIFAAAAAITLAITAFVNA